MPIGLGAGGSVGIAPETTYGTWTNTGIVWHPVLSENLMYQEDRYYSQAIRGQPMDNEVKQGYYRVEGDIQFEVDTRYLPLWLGAARLTRVKSGAGPYVYTFTPNGSASGAASAWTKSLSISINRNNTTFGYAGCVVTTYTFEVGDDGVLKMTAHVIGASESTQTAGAVTWVAPRILGASTSSIKTGAGSASSAPTLTADTNFDTFTFEANDNGAAQSRIGTTPARAAAYISLGKGEYTCSSTLDYQDKTEYTNYVGTTKKAVQLIGSNNATTDQVQLTVYNSPYDTYEVALGSMGDIVMANTTWHIVASGGTNPAFDIVVNSDANVT